jgi:ubiquinone/menaquinone biosynthesis C-methylase UbiE
MAIDQAKKYWDGQAKEHGASDLATAPDTAYRQLEISRILPHIEGPRVLDIGCGNGYSTLKFKEEYPSFQFTGADYSEQMIKEAKKAANGTNVSFIVADVRDLSYDTGLDRPYDTIISERCLINLLTWEEQKTAISEMLKCLAPGGKIILVENFMDGLVNLNELRVTYGLEPINIRWHNRYMWYGEIDGLDPDVYNIIHRENIGNQYYITSRVVYPAYAALMGVEVAYNHPLNYIASKLPSLGDYNYSPNMLYIIKRKS